VRYVARPQRRAASARPFRAKRGGLALRGVGNGRAGSEVGSLACWSTAWSFQVFFGVFRVIPPNTLRFLKCPFLVSCFSTPAMAFFGLRGRFSSIFGVFLRLYRCLLAPLSLQAPRGKRRFSWFFCENRPRGSRITMAGVEKYETSLTIKRTFKGIASYYGDWRFWFLECAVKRDPAERDPAELF